MRKTHRYVIVVLNSVIGVQSCVTWVIPVVFFEAKFALLKQIIEETTWQ